MQLVYSAVGLGRNRLFDSGEPLDHVQQVSALVGHVTTREIPEVAPVAKSDGFKRLLGSRALEGLPVKLAREVRVPIHIEIPIPFCPYHVDLPNQALVNKGLSFQHQWGAAPLHANLNDAVGLSHLLDHLGSLLDGPGHGFFAVGIFARLNGSNQMIMVPVLGAGNQYSVNVLAFQ